VAVPPLLFPAPCLCSRISGLRWFHYLAVVSRTFCFGIATAISDYGLLRLTLIAGCRCGGTLALYSTGYSSGSSFLNPWFWGSSRTGLALLLAARICGRACTALFITQATRLVWWHWDGYLVCGRRFKLYSPSAALLLDGIRLTFVGLIGSSSAVGCVGSGAAGFVALFSIYRVV